MATPKPKASTVTEYLAALPEDRREALCAVRKVILDNLDEQIEEGMQYGMIGYYIPHKVFPAGYHCDPKQPLPYAGLASQKNHMSLYLGCLYGSPQHERWFRETWAKTGKKLNMGKACIRFKTLDHLPLDVIAHAVRKVSAKAYIAQYEANLKQLGTRTKVAKPVRKKSTRTRAQAGKVSRATSVKDASVKKRVTKNT